MKSADSAESVNGVGNTKPPQKQINPSKRWSFTVYKLEEEDRRCGGGVGWGRWGGREDSLDNCCIMEGALSSQASRHQQLVSERASGICYSVLIDRGLCTVRLKKTIEKGGPCTCTPAVCGTDRLET